MSVRSPFNWRKLSERTSSGTCSRRNADFVRALGADYTIDYKSEDYVAVIQRETGGNGVDLVFDTIGGDAIERGALALKESGRLATIVDIPRPQSLLDHWGKNSTIHLIFTQQNRAKLDQLRSLMERGRIRPVIDSQMLLTEVASAHERIEQGGVRGKVVLDVAGSWRR